MGGKVPEMNKPIVILNNNGFVQFEDNNKLYRGQDNNSCIDLIHNDNDTQRTKHIDVRQLCAEGVISVVHMILELSIS